MSINIASNFELFAALPLDARTVAADITARDAITAGQRYEGLWCYVVDSDGGGNPATYQLQNGITNGDWVFINSGTALTGIGNAESIAVWSSGTNLSANLNFTRSNATGIVNNEQGLDLGVNTTTTRYIDPAGNDSNDGLTALTPWLTRQHAFNEMAAFLPGTYQIIAANGSYSEDLAPPYNAVGRALDSGGTIVENIGDEAVPANSIVAGSTIYENDIFGRGYSGSIRFAGTSFVGDNSGNAIASAAGLVFVRNSQFSQVDACVSVQFAGIAILESSTTGGTASNVGSLLQCEDGGFIYCATSYTLTGMTGGLVGCGPKSSVKFDESLTFSCTGTGAGSSSFIRIDSGDVALGEQNTFTVDNAQQPILMTGNAILDGGRDNQMDFANCDEVGNLTDNAFFSTSVDGSATYTISGTTPSNQNFFLDGQASVKNQLNTTSGNPEIPMSWFVAPALETTEFVLATDWRYKGSQTIMMPGTPTPSSGGWISPLGLADFAYPLYTARKNEIFSFVRIRTPAANGPNAGAVTDTYTVYVNGVATTMAGVIVDGDFVNITVNPQVLEPFDEVSVFALFAANTLAEDIRVVI
jgi:hypothetical protein